MIALLAACLGLTVAAGPVSRLALDTAGALHAPGAYLEAVLGAAPVREPPPGAEAAP